jgi:hypothetical protein
MIPTDLIRMIVGSTVRHGLTALSAYLVAKNLLAPEHASGFVTNLSTYALDALPLVLAYGWSLAQKYLHYEAVKF